MRAFELYDYVFLKNNPALSGTIERTNTESYEPLEDELIIAHTEVPADIINEFVTSGVPPVGYVFVEFEDESTGTSLVNEDDLTLLSRTFQIGDNVRRDGSPLTGAVVNLSELYLLAPILSCYPDLFLSKLQSPPKFAQCGPTCPSSLPAQIHHPNPHVLIHDVPSREVKHAQDLVKDDLIIADNWLGQVEFVEYDIVICLENQSIVVVRGSGGMYLPVRDDGKPLIALPEDEGWRPDIVVALQGWSHTIPLLFPKIGQFIVADRMVLRTGRWVRGSYDPKCPAQGTILDVRAGEVSVNWEEHNLAVDCSPSHAKVVIPPYNVSIYEHDRDFKDSASVLPRTKMTIYDHGTMPTRSQKPSQQKPVTTLEGQSTGHVEPASPDICTGQDVKIGNQVRFRDLSAAAVKYQGVGVGTHGSITRFDADTFYGWDLNEFKVLHIKQAVTVLWQDGSVSTVDSLSLRAYTLFEPELAPTDVILKRDGMRQREVVPQSDGLLEVKEFDEMTFFEKPHDLLPKDVGIIQTVDPVERVARVRWFKAPKIELRANGQVMSPLSRYGPIGDKLEDVSLYEIMSFPSLQRKRRDMCILASNTASVLPGKDTIKDNSPEHLQEVPSPATSSTAVTAVRPAASWLVQRSLDDFPSRWKPQTQARVDWFGEIVGLGLDGSNTVRLGGLKPCQDVRISSDSILALIEEGNLTGHDTDDAMDVDPWDDSDWSDDFDHDVTISETVEYEGGRRLDNDSGDENWESEDDGDADMTTGISKVHHDADVVMHEASDQTSEATTEPGTKSMLQLKRMLAVEKPPQFAILEREPPSDQFGLHSPSTASTFLKRISKEHRILATSLPEGEIYLRTYESRLDLLRCLIIGPRDTPYENAPFLIDFLLPEKFPAEPPVAHFHSWTSGLGRINPNLYEEGKICLSLLGTWSGKHESERWSDKATILQLLVSLQGLVFVRKPFYNEAGFEGYENDSAYTREAELYGEKAYLMARGFVKHALTQPPGGLEDILAWSYFSESDTSSASLLQSVIDRGRLVIRKSEEARAGKDDRLLDTEGENVDETKVFLRPLSRGASVMLNRIINELEEQLQQLDQGKNERGIEPTA